MNTKTIALLFVIFILVASSLYLVYLISDGSNPIALLNSRASEDPEPNNTEMEPTDNTPTPTIRYESTSPTVTGSATPTTTAASGLSPTVSKTTGTPTPAKTTAIPSPTPTIAQGIPTPTPTHLPVPPASPTPLKELPVAGVTDYLNPFVWGGAILILLALAL